MEHNSTGFNRYYGSWLYNLGYTMAIFILQYSIANILDFLQIA